MGLKKRLYDLAGARAQGALDRGRYAGGLLPRVDTSPGPGTCRPWPPGYSAALVVSADLELAWAWRYARIFDEPAAVALDLARRTRENLDGLLDVFARTDTPVTWATVGHLLLDGCLRVDGRAHPEMPRLGHFANELWRFSGEDWFEHDPCTDVSSDPEWYGPDLVDRVLAADPRHEIGCHTFSHVDFADGVCEPGVAEAELRATVAAGAARGIPIETMVFPGNRHGNFAALRACGFSAYRFHGRHHLGPVRRDSFGMLQIPGGLCLETPLGWPRRAWAATLCRCIDKAVETNTVVHLWFHPSCDPEDLTEVFPVVLGHAAERADVLWRTTMKGVVELCGEATVE